jgi:hypothetical protein
VGRWHSLFETDVTEHRPLKVLAASHRLRAGCSRIAQILAPHRGAGGIFQRPVRTRKD